MLNVEITYEKTKPKNILNEEFSLFLKCLFRTDKANEWTNELTEDNAVFCYVGTGEEGYAVLEGIPFTDNKNVRMQIEELFSKLIKENINEISPLKEEVFYFNIIDVDTKENCEDYFKVKKIHDFFRNFIGEYDEEYEGVTFFYVGHMDEKENRFHLHRLFKIKD